MTYQLRFTPKFEKEFRKLDKYTRLMIQSWIKKNLMDCDNPRKTGKALKGTYEGLWRYRIGDYRIICGIQDQELVILALSVGHRKNIYK